MTQNGAAGGPGDRVQITNVELKGDRILLEINGGPRKKKKWWQHITVEGMGGSAPLDQQTDSPTNPRGSIVTLVFDGYVPEMSVEKVNTFGKMPPSVIRLNQPSAVGKSGDKLMSVV